MKDGREFVFTRFRLIILKKDMIPNYKSKNQSVEIVIETINQRNSGNNIFHAEFEHCKIINGKFNYQTREHTEICSFIKKKGNTSLKEVES